MPENISKDKQRKQISQLGRLIVFGAWPLVGIYGLIVTVKEINRIGFDMALLPIGLGSLALLVYGLWALKRASSKSLS